MMARLLPYLPNQGDELGCQMASDMVTRTRRMVPGYLLCLMALTVDWHLEKNNRDSLSLQRTNEARKKTSRSCLKVWYLGECSVFGQGNVVVTEQSSASQGVLSEEGTRVTGFEVGLGLWKAFEQETRARAGGRS